MLSFGIERCSLKYFSDTKFVCRKIVEVLCHASCRGIAFKQDLSAQFLTFGRHHMFTVLLGKPNRLFHQNRSQDWTLISVLLNAVLTVSH